MDETASARLAEAEACEEDAPDRAAALLVSVDTAALAARERPRFALLANRVIGERLGEWLRAHRLLLPATSGSSEPDIEWRLQVAVAARQAGDHAAEAEAIDALTRAAPAPRDAVRALVGLAAAGFSAPGGDAAGAAGAALGAIAPLERVRGTGSTTLDSAFADAASRLAGRLLRRPLDDFRDDGMRAALSEVAGHSHRFRQRAGNALEQARAHALVARAGNALGDWAHGAAAARDGLLLLEAEGDAAQADPERAFLEQELAQALRGLGDDLAASDAQSRAEALAAALEAGGDSRRRFDARAARNRELLAFHAR